MTTLTSPIFARFRRWPLAPDGRWQWVLLLATLLLHTGLSAQRASAFPEKPPALIGKFSFTTLADPLYPTVQVAVEHALSERWSLHHQAGYLLPNSIISDLPEMDRHFGFRLRSGGRLYLQPYRPEKLDRTWLEMNFMYQYSNSDIPGDFCRARCSYFQRISYNRRWQVYALSLDFGVINFYTSRIVIESGFGLQGRIVRAQLGSVPPDAEFFTNGSTVAEWHADREGNELPVGIGLRFSVGYILK